MPENKKKVNIEDAMEKEASPLANTAKESSVDSKVSPETKKSKTENGATPSKSKSKNKDAAAADAVVISSPNYDLTKFHLTRILHNSAVRKSIALLGTFPDLSAEDAAIVLFEKSAFRESEVQTQSKAPVEENDEHEQSEAAEIAQPCKLSPSYFSSELKVQTEFINNIYGSFQCTPSSALNAIKTTVVYPATEKHIEKYSISHKFLINETPHLYETITLPYIESSQFSLEWVYNILEHKQEAERIVFEDSDPETGFILLPDLKWDGRNVESLYLLAIVHQHGIRSLRDLRGAHLPLLRNVRRRAAAAIQERYGLGAPQLRMYIHYQPSFYHLHVHINPVRNDAPGIWCEKSHMLDTVINNLELLPDYYQRATLPFVLYDSSKLLECFEAQFDDEHTLKILRKRHATADKAKEAKTEAEATPVAAKRAKLDADSVELLE